MCRHPHRIVVAPLPSVACMDLFKIYRSIIDPPLLVTRHNELVGHVFMMPTRGQAIFIGYIWILNNLLSGTGYWFLSGSLWYTSNAQQTISFVANRLCVLSFTNIPLLILFAGRNNVLLWLTNWPCTTFLLLHRWAAVICMLEAFVHSFMFLYAYSVNLYALKLSELITKGYWT